MQRLADDAAVEHVLYRHALLVVGLGIVGGMSAVRHAHGRHLLRRGAVVVHVAHEGGAEHLPRALPAIGAVMQHVARDRRRRPRAGAADAHLGVAVHGAEDDDGLAHAGLDHADGDADQRFGGGAAAEHVHMKIEADAEIAGDERAEGGVARLVGQHAVDVGGLEPGILDGIAHRPGAERARGLAGAARVGGLADAHDGVLVAQIFGRRRICVRGQRHGRSSWLLAGSCRSPRPIGQRRRPAGSYAFFSQRPSGDCCQ